MSASTSLGLFKPAPGAAAGSSLDLGFGAFTGSSTVPLKKRPVLGLSMPVTINTAPDFVKEIIHGLKYMNRENVDTIYDALGKEDKHIIDVNFRIKNTLKRDIIEILDYTLEDKKTHNIEKHILKTPILFYKSTGTSRKKTGLENMWLPASFIFTSYTIKKLQNKKNNKNNKKVRTYVLPDIISELSKPEGVYLNLLEHLTNYYVNEIILNQDDKINNTLLEKLNEIYKKTKHSFNVEHFINNLEIDDVSFKDLLTYKRFINHEIAMISKYLNTEEFNQTINKYIEKFKENKYNNRKNTNNKTVLKKPNLNEAKELNKKNNKTLFTKKFFNNNNTNTKKRNSSRKASTSSSN